MSNRKMTLGKKIAFALGVLLALAILMAIIGQRIAKKFQESARAIVVLNYYGDHASREYSYQLKYIIANQLSDTLKMDRVDIDHMNLIAYHFINETKLGCKPIKRYVFDSNKSLKLHMQYDKTSNHLIDVVSEGTAIRRGNTNLAKEIRNKYDKNQNAQKFLMSFNEAIINGFLFITSSDSSLVQVVEKNIETAIQLASESGFSEASSQLGRYRNNFKDLLLVQSKVNKLLTETERELYAARDYPFVMNVLINQYVRELNSSIKFYLTLIVILIILVGGVFIYLITNNIIKGAQNNLAAIESIANCK